MVKIDSLTVERLFSTTGSKVYESAADTVVRYSMQAFIESGVVVGLSGGADSVLLLCFLLEYRRRMGLDFEIICAHVNHGIRGEEAERDERFCQQLCDSLGVELIIKRYDVPVLSRGSGLSLEEAARITRYSVFDSIIRGRNDIDCCAVAHNMSDSAETVVFNVLRGSGARGAAGINPVRDNIIRPLIGISKKDIASLLDEGNIPYVTDSTNLCEDYTRNYIRQTVIPSFERIISDPEKMLCRFADNMRSDDDFIRAHADAFIKEHSPVKNTDLASLHYSVYIRVLAMLADKAGASVSSRIASDIHSLLSKDNFTYSLIGGANFVCERGECRVARQKTEGIDFSFDISMGVNDLSPLNAELILSDRKIDKTYRNVNKISIQANLSSAIIKGGLYLRSKKDGDTVYYGGMTHKLKKLFSDNKVPRSKRGLIPILCDDSGVVWVPGFGVRDDGVSTEERVDLYVELCIKNTEKEERIYSGSEFRT